MSGAEPVLRERHGSVLVVTLNRPEARNALNLALVGGLLDAVEELETTPDLSAGVLTGAGGGFCAGMDLRAFVAGESVWEGEGDDRGLRRFVTGPPRKPLIAAIEGFAVAGGLELALACDLIVAGCSARLGIPEVKRSLVAKGGALLRLPRRIGPGGAMKLALTGELIDGGEAREIVLVDELAQDGEALAVALALAGRIAANGPLAVRATKEILQGQSGWADAEFWERQELLANPVFSSRDAIEGAEAFAEKRDPAWRGE
jgi:enoyl-CoA hydratase